MLGNKLFLCGVWIIQTGHKDLFTISTKQIERLRLFYFGEFDIEVKNVKQNSFNNIVFVFYRQISIDCQSRFMNLELCKVSQV